MTRDHAHEFGSWLCRIDAYVGETASSQSLIRGQIVMYQASNLAAEPRQRNTVHLLCSTDRR